MAVFNRVYGAKEYKNCLLTHIPIHPQKLFRCAVNVHGHVHDTGITDNPEGRYFNVNLEFHDFRPVPFFEIERMIERGEFEGDD